MEGEIVLTRVDLLTLLIHKVPTFVCMVLADSIQRHMVTPASHPIGVGRLSSWKGERVWLTWAIWGTYHLISGGGGRGRIKWKKVCRHKSQKKKFVENVVKKNPHQMVTYILIEKAYDKNIYFITKKYIVFLRRWKKSLILTKTVAPPPYLMVRPWLLKGWMMSLFFSVKAVEVATKTWNSSTMQTA